jgi:5-(carboxyamino)imidazole ribonucleotide synthase
MKDGTGTGHSSLIARHSIAPGAMLGVLGGGQLGAMFASAARRLGYRVAVWDSDPDAPALRSADLSVSAPFEDERALDRFAGSIGAATYEWENIPAKLAAALEQRVPLRPSARILGLVQHRVAQKTFLAGRGFPVAPFHAAPSVQELTVPPEIGYPVLCKTATSGYDGKGQWRLTGPPDLAGLRSGMKKAAPGGWILERFLAFEKELSVLVVRGLDGDSRTYPVAENLHEEGILRISRVPARIEPRLGDEARDLARVVVQALNGVGVFCVEIFLMPDGRLYINEIAPRPHNSGHYTLDACTVSQFEQQVRAVCGLPLGETRLLCPAAMVNLIGDDLTLALSEETLRDLLRTAGAKLRIYGKKAVRPSRKMGHVTFLAEKDETAWGAAAAFRETLSLTRRPAAADPSAGPL